MIDPREDPNRISYFPQLDLIKGIAIISVILLHTIPRNYLVAIYAHFHIWQAVPVFFILLGITLAISFSHREMDTIGQAYSRAYLLSRLERIIIPFLVIFMISLVFGVIRGDFYFGWLNIMGYLPVTGNGNYFASILIQFIFVAPLIFLCYRRRPVPTIVALFFIELIFQLVVPHIGIFQHIQYLYSACIFRYFSAIAIGLFLAGDLLPGGRIRLLNKKSVFILAGFPISVAYLWLARSTAQPFPLFWAESNFQNLISYFYPAVLVAVLINWNFPQKNFFFRVLMTIGKASYHIFLVQILFFGFGFSLTPYVTAENYLLCAPAAVIVNLVVNVIVGLLFYFTQDRIGKSLRKSGNYSAEAPI